MCVTERVNVTYGKKVCRCVTFKVVCAKTLKVEASAAADLGSLCFLVMALQNITTQQFEVGNYNKIRACNV